jgi:uncharacterized repeat protein (TIGR03803 family)
MKQLLTTLSAVMWLAGITQAQITLTTLVSFSKTNGMEADGLTPGKDGNFYGTTEGGGTNFNGGQGFGNGTVFKLTTNGVLTTLVNFNSTNGSGPIGLTLGNDGNFYGMTVGGGTNFNGSGAFSGGDGTIFKVTTNGVFTTLVNFDFTNGELPASALTPGMDGNFYGTTPYGGTNTSVFSSSADGTVFKVTTNGVFATLVNFDYTNGRNPNHLTLGNDGNFYATASEGGNTDTGFYSNGMGTFFKVTANGVLTTLVNFAITNGADPGGALALGQDGNLYGTTVYGGNTNLNNGLGFGTVFKVTTNGILTTLASFAKTNGASPGDLTAGSDGNFYGTTLLGGNTNLNFGSGCGVVFKITTNGILTTLVSFAVTNGNEPISGLATGNDGNFYGTTFLGGNTNFISGLGAGTVFKLTIPPILNTPSFSNGMPQLTLDGLARPSVQIQTTTNLSAPWVVLTNLVFTNGNNKFSDFTATNSPKKFYRAMVP